MLFPTVSRPDEREYGSVMARKLKPRSPPLILTGAVSGSPANFASCGRGSDLPLRECAAMFPERAALELLGLVAAGGWRQTASCDSV